MDRLQLVPVRGQQTTAIIVDPDRDRVVVGRSSACDVRLVDDTVSRRHVELGRMGDRWTITDLDSKHGTLVNGTRLDACMPTPLSDSDTVRIGPFRFRVGEPRRESLVSLSGDESGSKIEPVGKARTQSVARQRLDLLLAAAAELGKASNERQLAEVLVRAARDGTGFTRVALLRPDPGFAENAGAPDAIEGGVALIAWLGPAGETAARATYSRSLLLRAALGEAVTLATKSAATLNSGSGVFQGMGRAGAGDNDALYGASLVSMDIHSALCCPLVVGEDTTALLYMDARGSEARVQSDSLAFCEALARLGAAALATIRHARNERERREIANDLRVARDVQKLMCPSGAGQMGPLRYALASVPGRYLAGDLSDVLDLGDGRVACFVGDVTGKGAGAAVLMAAVQGHLAARLQSGQSALDAVRGTNAFVHARSSSGTFVSLVLAVVDTRSGRASVVDAGHGYWAVLGASTILGTDREINNAAGLLLGVAPQGGYSESAFTLQRGDRLVMVSDGLVEQHDSAGHMHGFQAVLDVIRGASDPGTAGDAAIASVDAFAGSTPIGDDRTVLCVVLDDAG